MRDAGACRHQLFLFRPAGPRLAARPFSVVADGGGGGGGVGDGGGGGAYGGALAGRLRGALLVDRQSGGAISAEQVGAALRQLVSSSVALVDGRAYVQRSGIPQGAVAGALVCCLHYGALDLSLLATYLSRLPSTPRLQPQPAPAAAPAAAPATWEGSLLLRLIDDSLCVSAVERTRDGFLSAMGSGFPRYGGATSVAKTCVASSTGSKGARNTHSRFLFFGFVVKFSFSEISLFLQSTELCVRQLRVCGSHAGCVSCELVCVCVLLDCSCVCVIICPASTHTALVSIQSEPDCSSPFYLT